MKEIQTLIKRYEQEGDNIKELEEVRLEALAEQDAVLFATLCDIIGLSPEESGDKILYEKAIDRLNTDDLEDKPTKSRVGLKRSECRGLTIRQIHLIYDGAYNLMIPDEMKRLLTSAEHIALLYASGSKKGKTGLHNQMSYDFYKLVDELNQIAFPNIGYKINKWIKAFSTEPGEQRKRFQGLDENIRKAFVDSFHSTYIDAWDIHEHFVPYTKEEYIDYILER
jgi:hypothetical protein